MTATPYFDSYELKRSVKVDSIWVHNISKRKIKVTKVTCMVSEYIGIATGYILWMFTSDLLECYTPLPLEDAQ